MLRAAGLTVVEHSGWQSRRRPGTWEPRFIVVHATAAPRTQDDDTQVRVVRDGRSDLEGPIANACVDRRGRWHVLSAGRCNTTLAGTAGPYDGLGNSYALGIEACNDNGLRSPAEQWPEVQYRAYVGGVAAICKRLGWKAARAVGHKEHTPGRKTDPTFSMTKFRADVTSVLNGDEEDDMPDINEIKTVFRSELAAVLDDIANAVAGKKVNVTPGAKVPNWQDWSQVDAYGSHERHKILAAIAALAKQVKDGFGQDDLDEAAVVSAILASLSPEAVAGAVLEALTPETLGVFAAEVVARLPRELAEQIVAEMGQKLAV